MAYTSPFRPVRGIYSTMKSMMIDLHPPGRRRPFVANEYFGMHHPPSPGSLQCQVSSLSCWNVNVNWNDVFRSQSVCLFFAPKFLGPKPLPEGGSASETNPGRKSCCQHKSELLTAYWCRKTSIFFFHPKPCKEKHVSKLSLCDRRSSSSISCGCF